MLNPQLSRVITRAAPALLLTPNQSWCTRLRDLLPEQHIASIEQWCASQCLALNQSLRPLDEQHTSTLWYTLSRRHDANCYAQESGWRALLADVEAWQTCLDHNLNLNSPVWQQNEQSELFSRRARRYRNFLAEHSLLESKASVATLCANLTIDTIKQLQFPSIVCAGFVHLVPAVAALLRKLRQLGVKVYFCSQPILAERPGDDHCSKVACASEPEQLQQALSYTRNSDDACAIVAPQATLSELGARTQLPTAALFKLLSLASGAHPPAEFHRAFSQSPLAEPSERLELARAESSISALPRAELSLASIISTNYLANSPEFAAKVDAINDLAQQPAQNLQGWSKLLERTLLTRLTNPTAQASWQRAIAELRELDWLALELDFAELLLILRLTLYRQRPTTVVKLSDYLGQSHSVWLLRSDSIDNYASPKHKQIALSLSAAHPAVKRRVLTQLRHNASELICSGDELGLEHLSFAYRVPPSTLTTSVDFDPEPQAPAWSPNEPTPQALNKLISAQQSCPFQSFAVHRLQLGRPPAETALQPDAGIRGQALHQILEQLGRAYPGGWQALDAKQLRLWVQDIVRQQARHYPHCDGAWQRREQRRLLELLEQLRQMEQQRPPYVIEHVEQTREFAVLGYKFQLRVDRIDKLPNGKRVLIDYKSGAYVSRAPSMAPEKFTDPQAGIYSLASKCEGVALLQVNARNVDYFGWGSNDTQPIASSRSYRSVDEQKWQEFMQQWRQQLEQIFGAYINGEAAVHPQSAQSCRRCHLQALCRIQSIT